MDKCVADCFSISLSLSPSLPLSLSLLLRDLYNKVTHYDQMAET